MVLSTLAPLEPRLRRWTRQEYYRLAELGLIPERHVQLIEGEIFEMSPQGSRHGMVIGLLERALRAAFGPGFWIRSQLPVALPDSEPEPDLSVVPGKPRDYPEHPTSAVLVVEVAETTLAFDSRRKASMYAWAGIQEYWIVNLVEDCLDVYRDPLIESESSARYASVKRLRRDDTISPLAASGVKVQVRDLLP